MRLYLFIFSILFLSCQKTPLNLEELAPEDLSKFDCLNKKADENFTKEQVIKELLGNWQLKAVATMLPSKTIDNIKVEFMANNIAKVFKNEELLYSVSYTLEQKTENNYSFVRIDSSKDIQKNLLQGQIRICPAELLIDQGMAFDAPAYFFRKL